MRLLTYILFTNLFITSACQKYLSVKPDQSLETPTTVQGLQALMDNERYVVQFYPTSADLASDYFYLPYETWAALGSDFDRNTYIWEESGMLDGEWRGEFERILVYNVVLAEIDDAQLQQSNELDRDRVKGSAHFYRGWRYLMLSQIFAPHYQPGINDSDWGLPLRANPDINLPTVRNTLTETYDFIINDLKQAAYHLPATQPVPIRPSKATAFAALARVHLIMGDWDACYRYADSCLRLRGELMDYNDIDYLSDTPFDLFNQEVLLHTTIVSNSAPFMPSRARVDTTLYSLYQGNDLRKLAYYFRIGDRTYAFKGSYTGEGNSNRSALLFAGLATDEVYLMKAEALARLRRGVEAIETLNALLVNRYSTDWQPYQLENVGDELLGLILEEREKSLAFRAGIRWSDLRRLNTEERFAKTLVRELDGERYTLPPNDLRYTFLIPTEIIQLTGMPQNRR